MEEGNARTRVSLTAISAIFSLTRSQATSLARAQGRQTWTADPSGTVATVMEQWVDLIRGEGLPIQRAR